MNIVCTGSEGFIGTHLVRELRDVGHIVTGMDIKDGPDFNAADPRAIERIFLEAKPHAVLHLASQVGRIFGEDDVMRTVNDHAGMTAVVAQMAGAFDARMIYASTDEVYGDNPTRANDEFEGPWSQPYNLHGVAKLWGEQVCKLYAPKKFTALRFSMPFGPWVPVGRGRSAIVNLLWQAKHEMPMTVYKGAERSWCWVGDSVRAARLAIENGQGPYNVGRSDCAVAMETLAEMACHLTGASTKLIQVVPAPANETIVKVISTKRIRSLGWEPEVSLEDGMRRTLETWVDFLDENGTFAPDEVAAVAG